VFTSPWADIIVRENDKMYVFGHPTVIRETLNEFAAGFLISAKGEVGLRSNIPLSNFSELRQSMKQHMGGGGGGDGIGSGLPSVISEGDETSMKYVTTIQQYNDAGLPDPIYEGIDERGTSQESKIDSGVQIDHLPS
jgi:hypothetical protein